MNASKQRYLSGRFVMRLIGWSIGLAVLGVLAWYDRESFVYPGAFHGRAMTTLRAPPRVQIIAIRTEDGESLEMWRLDPAQEKEWDRVVLIFGGDAGWLGTLYPLQEWLADEVGVRSYAFDYRGFGRSSGWPSEEGIYRDTRAVLQTLTNGEHLRADRITYLGFSFGTGPAAYAATVRPPNLLVLVAPYLSLPECDSERFWYNPLMPRWWPIFPVRTYLSTLHDIPLIIAHGESDTEIPVGHSNTLVNITSRSNPVTAWVEPGANHQTIFSTVRDRLAGRLREQMRE